MTHLVMFRLHDPHDAGRIAGLIAALEGRVPGLRSLRVGEDVVRSERSWDLGLVAEFDDAAALNAYQSHPAHLAIVEDVGRATSAMATVDFVGT